MTDFDREFSQKLTADQAYELAQRYDDEGDSVHKMLSLKPADVKAMAEELRRKARELYAADAGTGDIHATYMEALMNYAGIGGKVGIYAAWDGFSRAALHDHAEAVYFKGCMLLDGNVYGPNPAAARLEFVRAAKLGSGAAALALADELIRGKTVKQDLRAAEKLIDLARSIVGGNDWQYKRVAQAFDRTNATAGLRTDAGTAPAKSPSRFP